ncbi:major facilitator superfamily domain-containing protein [Pterulicium gracile]|uniref:Major facilitator superfamily domain-containing protein n=1 Tax=Pterulicium gracile TaxID=1884261 RepID=A0A5C3QCS4_9AGAR|nr:major facilitator superfamily domain-containing protein [Pterula gracilis]
MSSAHDRDAAPPAPTSSHDWTNVVPAEAAKADGSLPSVDTHIFESTKENHRDATVVDEEAAVSKERVVDGSSIADSAWGKDERNPRNWILTCIVSLFTFIPPLASSMMAPGLPEVAIKYNITNSSVLSLTPSIFLLAFAIGPLLFAPLSEIYGRSVMLHSTNILSIAFSLGCAFSPDTGSFIGFRFLLGLSGSAPVAVGAGTISDLFAPQNRASAMAVYAMGPLLGPSIGPIAGGYIAQYADIKYVFITIAGLCGVASVIGAFFLRETYAPVIQYQIAKKEGDVERMKHLRAVQTAGSSSSWEYLGANVKRPLVYLAKSFVCFMLSLYMAVICGVYYLMFVTFPRFFAETYGFQPGSGGLVPSVWVGLVTSTAFGGRLSDRLYQSQMKKNGGDGKPEFRMPGVAPGAIAVPIGLFWYGWSAQAKPHFRCQLSGRGYLASDSWLSSCRSSSTWLILSSTVPASAHRRPS